MTTEKPEGCFIVRFPGEPAKGTKYHLFPDCTALRLFRPASGYGSRRQQERYGEVVQINQASLDDLGWTPCKLCIERTQEQVTAESIIAQYVQDVFDLDAKSAAVEAPDLLAALQRAGFTIHKQRRAAA